MISHLIIKWPTISSYPNLHQLNYEVPLFYANSGNIASLTSQPRCLSIRLAWSINLRAVPELASTANKTWRINLAGGERRQRCGQGVPHPVVWLELGHPIRGGAGWAQGGWEGCVFLGMGLLISRETGNGRRPPIQAV